MSGSQKSMLLVCPLDKEQEELIKVAKDKWSNFSRNLEVEIVDLEPQFVAVGLYDEIEKKFGVRLHKELIVSSVMKGDWEWVAKLTLAISEIVHPLFDGIDEISACYLPRELWFKQLQADMEVSYFEKWVDGMEGRIEKFVLPINPGEDEVGVDFVFDHVFFKNLILQWFKNIDGSET